MTDGNTMDQAAMAEFEADLRDMTLDEVEAEMSEVQERIDRDTDWVEALSAKARVLQSQNET